MYTISKFSGTLLFCLSFCFFYEVSGQDLSTFQSRKQWLLKGLSDVELISDNNTRGKHNLPKACARLWNDPYDKTALEYITNVLDHPEQSMFDFPGVALALGKFKNSFAPWQLDAIKADLEQRCVTQNKPGLAGFLGHGTENHALMMWTSAYLFGQYFPDAKWANGWTSAELMKEMRDRMLKTFKNVYRIGYTEYLSTTYEVVMNFPVAILLEFAEDPQVKEMAEAYLLYKWSLQSLNNFDGRIIAPYGRMNTQEDYRPEDPYVSGTLYMHWLYWGWGENTQSVKISDFKEYWETTYAIYYALSDVVPEEIFLTIGNGNTAPYVHRSSASTFGHYGAATPHMMMRKVYRDHLFAIGTGNFRWVPGGDYADHDTNPFNIIWHSPDRFNFINCTHPYWYSDGEDKDRTSDTWYKGGISPFMQTAHHENSVIVLFNIPEKDPWTDTPNAQKWAWRDGHAGNLIKRGMLRYPKSMDEKVAEKGWIFLREGETYIGIKPLKSYYEQPDLVGKGLDGFNIVKSDHAQTGFIFEVGTAKEYGDFKKFQNRLIKNKLSVDWKTMEVTYTDSQKNRINMQYQSGLTVRESFMPEHLTKKGIKGLAESIPLVTINGKTETPYQQWPMIESPLITMDNSVLNIQAGRHDIQVDWNGDYPVIQRKNR